MKIFKHFGLFLALVVLSINSSAQKVDSFDLNTAPPRDPTVVYGVLPNGLTYYIRQNNKPENRVELRLAVKVGSTMEDDDQQGLAHFLEHMAFNGTKNFPKNDLVNYLESIGTKFGPHLNAYTSFDETVYMLRVPTDSTQYVKKGMQILRDWAGDISFDSLEIEKERGVVIEEWRLRLGAGERMRKQYWPLFYGGSRYGERLPIGVKDVLDTFGHQTLKNFYKKWYRPDHMAVAITGNIDVKKMEAMIKEMFGNLPMATTPSGIIAWPIPARDSMTVAVVKDKENTYTMLSHSFRHAPLKNENIGDYRIGLVHGLITQMFNARLQERINSPNPPMVYGYGYYANSLRTISEFSALAIVDEKGIEKGLTALIEEEERMRRHGFTDGELKRAKMEFQRYYEEALKEKDKKESERYVREYVSHFLEGEFFPGIEMEYAYMKKFMPAILLSEINRVAASYITPGKNEFVMLQGVDKEGAKLPNEKALKDLIKTTRGKDISPYKDDLPEGDLMNASLTPKPASPTKENPTFGTKEWTLPNGIKVILKTTDFKNNEILMSATMPGGSSNVEDKMLKTASMATTVITESGIGNFTPSQLEKYMSGKIAGVYPQILDTEVGFSGNATTEDLELLFQMIYQYAVNPRKDPELFKAIIQKERAWYENQALSPNTAFSDTISRTMSNYHPRSQRMRAEDFDKLKMDEIFASYALQFQSFNGMTFTFVGNTDEKTLKPLTEKYLGNLPGGRSGQWKDNNIRPPKGIIEKTVYRGIEPKSSVRIQYTGDFEWNYANRLKYQALVQLASIKLREALREDEGGTYGVGVYGSPFKIPYSGYNLIVNFGCDPTAKDKLVSKALEVIEQIKQNGASAEDLQKIKETMLREMETNRKENNYWLRIIESFVRHNDNPEDIKQFESVVKALKGTEFKTLAAQYFNNSNRASFYLMPETK